MATSRKRKRAGSARGKSGERAPARKTAAGKRPAAAGKAAGRARKAQPSRAAKGRKAAPAKSATAASPRRRTPVPAQGPLTLDEAKALARARQPQLAAKRVAAEAAPAATPASVAAERKRLHAERRAEIARRVREYRATMTLLKQRGARAPSRPPRGPVLARGPVPAPGPGDGRPQPVAAPAGFVPLQVLAEGDSWFDYPPHVFKGGLVPRLERRLGVPILNLAKAGDEVRFMLGVEQRQLIAEHLTNGCPAGGPWDVMLFSGGGNDIVDDPLALWLRDFDAALPPAQQIDTQRYAAALALVRAGYEDLIALRDRLSPGTHLVFHGYDFALPDGRGVCFTGPWLKPAFDLRGFPSQAAAAAVVRVMLEQFAAMLAALAGSAANVTFINAQGTLQPVPSEWHNELHPSSDGYDRFADRFHAELRALFPTRVA